MTLYTKEQLDNTVNAIQHYIVKYDAVRAQEMIDKHLKALKPIEFPTEEEIYKQGFLYTYLNELPDENAVSHIAGAKFIINNIKTQTT